MDQATIDGCLAKVSRANVLAETLAAEWSTFLDGEPWPSRIEHDAETGCYTVYLDFTTPPPPVFGVIVGELAHDLRSALDHLAWTEAVEFLDREPTRDEARVVMYPIAWDHQSFRSAQVLRYMSKDAAALMKRQQPYERANSDEGASLRAVQWFNRLDKHRTLQVTAVAAPSVFSMEQLFIGKRSDVSIAKVQPHLQTGERVEGDTKVVSVRFAPEGVDPEMTVEGQPPFNPRFGDLPADLRGADVQVSLKVVREIVEDFADLLP